MDIYRFLQSPDPNIYHELPAVSHDLETTNIDKGDARNEDNQLVLGVYGSEDSYKLHQSTIPLELIEEVGDKIYVAHNAMFELSWMYRQGIDILNILPWDTCVAEYILTRNTGLPIDLDSCLQRRGLGGKESLVSKLIKSGVCPSTIPRKLLTTYCLVDTSKTYALYKAQLKEATERGLLGVILTRCLLLPVLVEMQFRGMYLDSNVVERVKTETIRDINRLNFEIADLSNGKEINWSSPQQVAEFIYTDLGFKELTRRGKVLRNKPSKKFPEGTPKTDVNTLAALKATNKRQRKFLEVYAALKKAETRLSKYVNLFTEAVEATGGILRCNYNTTIANTLRLTSSKPNFQNFDRELKCAFAARYPDWNINERDYAQLEYRIAVALAHDKYGIDSILNDVDRHAYTRDYLLEHGETFESDDPHEQRQDSKPRTFKPLFAGTTGTDAEKAYYAHFLELHEELAQVQAEWKREAYSERKQTTVTGLVFDWNNATMNRRGTLIKPDGRPIDQSVANYPIQYLATGEVVPIGLIYLRHSLKNELMESFIVNTVHDSIVSEVKPEESEKFNALSEYAMSKYTVKYLKEVYDFELCVPLDTEAKESPNWGG